MNSFHFLKRTTQIFLFLSTFIFSFFIFYSQSFGKNKNAHLDRSIANIDPIPSNNNDLECIIKKASQIKKFAEKCLEAKCPKSDCKKLGQLLQAIWDAQVNLRAMDYFIDKALKDHSKHHGNLAKDSIIT